MFRDYDPEKDKEAVLRIWREVGWIEEGKDRLAEVLARFISCGRALVAEIDGAAECLVNTAPATMRYLDQDLAFSAVLGVTTSRIARKQGLASRLAALAVGQDAAAGAQLAGLGIFEQGFYNQLGFGSGGYEYWFAFDPARLRVDVKARVPRRLTTDDWAAAHAARLARLRGHGSLNVFPAVVTEADMVWTDDGFGLGYYDGPAGELTHYLWCKAKGQSGPYSVRWASFQTREQFLELMALLRNLGDQIRLVWVQEPPGVQLQDLIEQPFKQRQISKRSDYESTVHVSAYWQVRMCDLAGCLERTHLPGDAVRFNLALTDPIERFLDDDAPWRGLAGDYVVTLGPSSGAEPGTGAGLPTLTASVGAFTRMWLGARPATGLAMTDDLAGPQELLEALDWALRLPDPKLDWEI
ncbi:MAG: GNAT family N-acetyltransferase [Anaerolineae bacterium]|nr:GNAT family N-acetyltransferase [Anaerolineae bacterium]